MKKIIIPVMLIILALVSSNCAKDETTDTSNMGMSAKLTGVEWTAESTTAAVVNGMLRINGTTTDKSVLSVEIQNVKQGGTYSLSETSSDFAIYTIKQTGLPVVTYDSRNGYGSGGEVSVTKINKLDATISGTFNFYLSNMDGTGIDFSEGVFNNLKYVTIN